MCTQYGTLAGCRRHTDDSDLGPALPSGGGRQTANKWLHNGQDDWRAPMQVQSNETKVEMTEGWVWLQEINWEVSGDGQK